MLNSVRPIATALAVIGFAHNASAACVYDQDLSGQNLQVGTMLNWSTAYEEDNAVFIVERSDDGSTFTDIGKVDAAGTTTDIQEYNFLDIMANAERSFYRLKQVDEDGTFSYSEVVAVPQVYTNNFMVARMSNVATQDLFEWTIDSMKDGDLGLSVTNLLGEEVYADELMLTMGLNDVSVDLSANPEGIYKVAMTMEDETETLVVKRVTAEIIKKTNVASSRKINSGRN